MEREWVYWSGGAGVSPLVRWYGSGSIGPVETGLYRDQDLSLSMFECIIKDPSVRGNYVLRSTQIIFFVIC